jgi:hypothetical protein
MRVPYADALLNMLEASGANLPRFGHWHHLCKHFHGRRSTYYPIAGVQVTSSAFAYACLDVRRCKCPVYYLDSESRRHYVELRQWGSWVAQTNRRLDASPWAGWIILRENPVSGTELRFVHVRRRDVDRSKSSAWSLAAKWSLDPAVFRLEWHHGCIQSLHRLHRIVESGLSRSMLTQPNQYGLVVSGLLGESTSIACCDAS